MTSGTGSRPPDQSESGRDGRWGTDLAAATLLLLLMALAMFSSARLEAPTWDESVHLAAGYSYLTQGDFRLNWEHPPLGKILAAAALLPLQPRIPLEYEGWRNGDTVLFSAVFLYRNRIKPDTLLLLGRAPMMLLTLALGGALFWWTRRHFGPAVAVVTLFLFALDPNVIAHGRYATTDLIAALTMFLSVITWTRYLRSRRWPDLAVAGLALGLALASKFSALFLAGLLPLLYVLAWWQEPRRHSLRRMAASLLVLAMAGMLVVAACYWPETRRMLTDPETEPLAGNLLRNSAASEVMYQVARTTGIPDNTYLRGLEIVADHNEHGHPGYLLGTISDKGSWAYFPIVMALKTPIATLLLLVLGFGAAIWAATRGRLIERVRSAPLPVLVAVVTPIAYLLFCMSGNLNLGIRHILPAYPFLFVLAAVALVRKPHWPLVMLIIGLHAWEFVRISPHYLAFFNSVAGGPAHGPAYLVDSNIDWGQDIKKFGHYCREHGVKEPIVSYFGTADVEYYVGPYVQLRDVWNGGSGEHLDSVVAISATLLQGLYSDREKYRWFREREPDERIGHSIYVYDLRDEEI